MRVLISLIAVLVWANLAGAVQPDEMLDDPVLEQRARDISKDLRCLVCMNESIDDSNASLARDLRILVRERLVEGDSDDQVKAFIVERYGEFALLRPKTTGANVLLWWSGPILLGLALGLGVIYIRRRSQAAEPPIDALSADEEKRLNDILGRN